MRFSINCELPQSLTECQKRGFTQRESLTFGLSGFGVISDDDSWDFIGTNVSNKPHVFFGGTTGLSGSIGCLAKIALSRVLFRSSFSENRSVTLTEPYVFSFSGKPDP